MREEVKYRIDNVIGMIYEDRIVTEFPTSAMLLMRHIGNCEVTDYRRLAEKTHTSVREISRCLESSDGCTIYQRSKDRYLIAVNTGQGYRRLRWTVAHEFGHILAGHFLEISEEKLEREWYLEEEANYFAANFLAPLPAICVLGITGERELAEKFGLSKTAAAYRWREFQYSGFGWADRSFEKPVRRVRGVDVWPDSGESYSL